jgi:ribosomal protein S1
MKGIDQATGRDLKYSILPNLQIGAIFSSTIIHIKSFGFFIKIETNQG